MRDEPLTFINYDPRTGTRITWKEVSKGILKFEMNRYHWYELILYHYSDNDDISDAGATLYEVEIVFRLDNDQDNIVHEFHRHFVDRGEVVYLTNLVLDRYTEHLPKTGGKHART